MTNDLDRKHLEEMLGKHLFEDFEQQFEVVYANTNELKKITYAIRHELICQDLGFNISNRMSTGGLTIDCFDCHSHHILMKHRQSERYVGTIRLIVPQNNWDKLSINKELIESDWYLPKKLGDMKLGTYAEISNLALVSDFHRREIDQHSLGSGLNQFSNTFPTPETRDFPKITMGLYLAATAVARQFFYNDVFAVMTPMLFKKLRGYGLLFQQASGVFEDNGAKAVYHLDIETGMKISKTLFGMNDCISSQLSTQLALFPTVSESDSA